MAQKPFQPGRLWHPVIPWLTMTESESTSPEELVERIKELRRLAWASSRPPATEKEVQQQYMQDRLRQLSADLLQRGVTLAILEGTF